MMARDPFKLFTLIKTIGLLMMVSFLHAETEKKQNPSTPKVESKAQKRIVRQEPEKAIIEGTLNEHQDKVLDSLQPEQKETPIDPQSIPSDDSDSDQQSYEEVNPNTLKEPNSPQLINDPNALPQLTQKAKKQSFTSTSASKQFTVLGHDSVLCNQLSSLSDAHKKDFLDLIGEPDKWKRQIFIKLYGKPGELPPNIPITSELQIIGDVPIFTLNVHIGRSIDIPFLKQKLIEALICERALQEIGNEFLPDSLEIPQWLIIGIAEALLWNKEQADRHLYAALFQRGEVMPLDKLFSYSDPMINLDAATLSIYRASAGALTLCLINQGGGKQAFKKLIDRSFPKTVDDTTLLKQVFPNLHLSPNSLHKWWALQLANMATPPLTQAFTALQTEDIMSKALCFTIFDPKTNTLQEWNFSLNKIEDIQKLDPEKKYNLFSPAITELVQLNYRAFPPQRPIILEYIRILESLNRHVTPSDLTNRLTNLEKERQLIKQAGTRTRDYLDWYTIVNATDRSSSFDQYLQTVDLMKKPVESSPTPLSEYLDDIESYMKDGEVLFQLED